jgi:arylsulfatase A-like enzyme
MRFFFRVRRGWPTIGLALAAGLVVADCLFVAGPYLIHFHMKSLWPLILSAVAMYVGLFVALDLAVQWLGPDRARRSGWLRGGILLTVALALVVASGEARSIPLLGLAAVFAVLTLGRPTWPIAALAAVLALQPLFEPPLVSERAPRADAPRPPEDDRPPSFLVVVLDTLRADHTSAYGYERNTTPNLARLASRGIRFDDAYATGCWSLPSHASLFTGLIASRHGAHNEHLALEGDHPTLAEILTRHGYQTASFTGNPWIGDGTGMARGFQLNHESWRTGWLDLMLLANRVYIGLLAPDGDKGGADTVEALERWLAERDPERPYFAFVNVFEAHAPYQRVPRRFRRRFARPDLSLRALEAVGMRVHAATQHGSRLSAEDAATGLDLLDGAAAAADDVLGRILDLVGDEAIVAVMADHGELFGEHALFGHSNTLYEPLVRVPMVLAGKDLPAGRAVEATVSLADVMPTLLALADIQPPPALDGIDLGPLLAGDASPDARRVRAEQFRSPDGRSWRRHRPGEAVYLLARKQAVVGGGLKRIVAEDGSDVGYDLHADPAEERPFPGRGTRLSAWVPEPDPESQPVPLDALPRKMLQVLGYLQQ